MSVPTIAYPAEAAAAREMLDRVMKSVGMSLTKRCADRPWDRIKQRMRSALERWHVQTRTDYRVKPRLMPGELVITLRVDWHPWQNFAGGYIVAEFSIPTDVIHPTWYPALQSRGVNLGSPRLPAWKPAMSRQDFADRMRLKRAGIRE